MSKVLLEIDHTLPQDELFKFLKDNKKALMSQKKAVMKRCESVSVMPSYEMVDKDGTTKAVSGEAAIPDTATSLIVESSANASMWCDTAMDVLLRDGGKKSIKERKGLIPHIHDHLYETLAEVGDVMSIYYQDVPLKQFNIKKDGTVQILTFKTEIIKEYNPPIFEKYRKKKIRQHSIGLRYISLDLAINRPNDEYYEDEYKLWKKWIDQVINKEVPESMGYFWVVAEFMLLENSCVLIGANQLTSVLSTSEKGTTSDQPDNESTEDGPVNKNDFDLNEELKKGIKFF